LSRESVAKEAAYVSLRNPNTRATIDYRIAKGKITAAPKSPSSYFGNIRTRLSTVALSTATSALSCSASLLNERWEKRGGEPAVWSTGRGRLSVDESGRTMHRSDASPVATTATEPRRHRWHSSACISWPGKSWRWP